MYTSDGASHQRTMHDHDPEALLVPHSRTQLVLVERLCFLGEGGALLDDGEVLDVHCLPGCAAGCHPWGLLFLCGFFLDTTLPLLFLPRSLLARPPPLGRFFLGAFSTQSASSSASPSTLPPCICTTIKRVPLWKNCAFKVPS